MLYFYAKKVIVFLQRKKKEKHLEDLKSKGLKIGSEVYFVSDFFIDPSHCYMISIGNNCTFAPNVKLIAHDASTKRHIGYSKLGQINIGDNCYFGDSAIILPNVTIGPGSVIAAGAVVTRSVPARSVVAGVPARVISDLDSYIKKSKLEMETCDVFASGYRIDQLDSSKIKKLFEATKDGIAYIE